MSSGPESYSYQTLNGANREFRLLYLIPGQDPDYQQNDLIEAELKIASLNDLPEYTALSYCWTSAAAEHTIWVHGHSFSVRPNLFDFLKILKEERYTGLIFIDAICINQNDLNERSGQVQMMGQIYRSAVLTTAWLGSLPAAEEAASIAVFDLFTELGTDEAVRTRLHETWDNFQSHILISICSSPYWSRMWIVQEVLVARILVFQLGGLKIESGLIPELLTDDLKGRMLDRDRESVAFGLRLAGNAPGDITWSVWTFLNLIRLRTSSKFDEDRKFTLERMVSIFAHQLCSDPHDKLFGILDLVAEPVVHVDYNMPLSELYVRILLTSACELELLTCGTRMPRRQLQRVSQFIEAIPLSLALAFGWSGLHPTVALLIQETTMNLQNQLSRYLHYPLYKDRWSFNQVQESFPQATPILNSVRYKALCAWLNVCKVRNAAMKMPGGVSEVRRYSEWVQMVEDVKTEVWETMHTPEYVARLEQAFPLEEAEGAEGEIDED